MDLWATLSYFIESGCEGRKVDLKRELHLETKAERARFAKDVLAMANTAGGTGYLVIGVLDAKERTSLAAEDYIVGFDPPDPDAFQRVMLQSVDTYCDPPPEIGYETLLHPGTGRKLSIVAIPRSFRQPHLVKVDGEGLRANDAWVRRGPETFKPCREELRRMFESGKPGPRVVVNFGRPMTPAQVQQLQDKLGVPVYEVISVPSNLDDSLPYEPQIRTKVQETALTPEEWASLPLVLNVHPFAPATALLLGFVHGLAGYFPDVLRMARIGDTNEFGVLEILHPQAKRDAAARTGV